MTMLFKSNGMGLLFKSIVILALMFQCYGCGGTEDGGGEPDSSVYDASPDALPDSSPDAGIDALADIDARWDTCGDCIRATDLAHCVPEPTVEHCIGDGPGSGCTKDVFDTCGECVQFYNVAACYQVHLDN